MIMDNQLVFSNAQSLITAASTASTTVIDMTVAQDLGVGDGVGSPKILGLVGTAFTTTNSGTLNVQFQGSTDSSTWTTYAETGAMAAASLTAGQQIIGFAWPKRLYSNTALPRYIRLYYGVANSFTAGTITAAIVLQRDDADDTAALYPSNFTVA